MPDATLEAPGISMFSRFAKYLGVGAFCAVLNNIFLIAIVWAGYSYLAGLVIVFGPMVLIGYALQTMVTFGKPRSLAAFLRYSGVMLASYPLWIVGLFLFCDVLRFPIWIASPLMTVLFCAWTYILTCWAIARSVTLRSVWRRCASKFSPL